MLHALEIDLIGYIKKYHKKAGLDKKKRHSDNKGRERLHRKLPEGKNMNAVMLHKVCQLQLSVIMKAEAVIASVISNA